MICAAATGCSLSSQSAVSSPNVSELWEDPTDLEQRDLFYGPGGLTLAPAENSRFKLHKIKDHGRNAGYTVFDERGREWSAKLGVESRVEVAVSRIVWAVGYHQPALYHVRQWTLTDDGKDAVQPPARFRFDDGPLKKHGDWSWRDNPFSGTRELKGLFALMIIFNNWDLKSDQNAVYESHDDKGPEKRQYLVRDLGASLGKSGMIIVHTKDDADGFESESFINSVGDDSLVNFGFRQSWRDPLGLHIVKVADLHWICGLLHRLSDKQWHDAFRAGGFTDEEAARYIRQLQRKIDEGMSIDVLSRR